MQLFASVADETGGARAQLLGSGRSWMRRPQGRRRLTASPRHGPSFGRPNRHATLPNTRIGRAELSGNEPRKWSSRWRYNIALLAVLANATISMVLPNERRKRCVDLEQASPPTYCVTDYEPAVEASEQANAVMQHYAGKLLVLSSIRCCR